MSIELVMLSNHFILCLPFPFCLQSYPASGSFPVSQLFVSGGQSITSGYYPAVVVWQPSRVWLSATARTAAHQAPLSFPITRSLLKLMSIESVVPSSHLILCCYFVLLPSIFPSTMVFSSGSLHQVAKVLELQPQHQSFQWIFRVDFLWVWLVWSPRRPRDSQESSLAPQFKSSDCLALSLLHGPTLTSIPDCWKNHRFD